MQSTFAPHPSHREIGIKSLEANLHVLMEKPLAVDKADCEALINAYEKTGQKKSSLLCLIRGLIRITKH